MICCLTVKQTSLDDCTSRAVLHLRKAAVAEGDDRAANLRSVAEAMVDARAHFPTRRDRPDEPDWRGRSYDYKHWVADIYSEANIRGEGRRRMQGAIVYHVSSILHERLDPDELSRIGLHTKSLRDRRAVRRERETNINRLVAETEPFDNDEDANAAHDIVLALLGRMTDKQRAAVLRAAMLSGTSRLAGRVRMLLPEDDEVTI